MHEIDIYFLHFAYFFLLMPLVCGRKVGERSENKVKLDPTILETMDAQGGMLTAADMQQLGYSRGMLQVYARAGLLERYGCGVYVRPHFIVDDMLYLQRKFPLLIYSHESALYLNGLSERTPFKQSLTIPSSCTLPRSVSQSCTCFYIKSELHELGLAERQTPHGNTVRCYNAERSICDILRSRSRMDVETLTAALKNYFLSKQPRLNRLAEYAIRLGVLNKLTPYLEVLV